MRTLPNFRKITATLALASSVATGVTLAAAPSASADIQSRTLVVRVIVMEFPGSPAPSSTRATELFNYAKSYWTGVSGGAFKLLSDGQVYAASTKSTKTYGSEFTQSLPSSEGIDVNFVVTNMGNGGASPASRGNPGTVIINRGGNAKAAAHEFGHIFGLGHSYGLVDLGDGDNDEFLPYANTWSVMGSGTGTPDGAQMELLGLVRPEIVTDSKRTIRVTPMGLAGRTVVCWMSNSGITRYCADYRKSVGTDAGVRAGARILIYRSEYNGYATFTYDELKVGREHKYGSMWINFVKSGDKATVTFTRSH